MTTGTLNHHQIALRNPAQPDELGFPFATILQPGDLITFGQACSEPVGLVKELLRQGPKLRESLGRLKLFVAGSYSGLIRPEHGDQFDFLAYGAIGDSAALAKAGQLQIFPIHYSYLPKLLTNDLTADVVLLQLSAPDSQGRHSLGVANDFQLETARHARVVIAEINTNAPFSPNALLPQDIRVDHAIWTQHPLIEGPALPIDPISEKVADHVASLIPNGATLQMGVGNLMAAICNSLRSHKQLGIHTGIMIDGMINLMKVGVIDNSMKRNNPGLAVAGSILGSRDAFEFAHNNRDLLLAETHITHGATSLALQSQFCSINSAVEVDLTGQVNSEEANGRYVGAVGGQVDFVRAASRSYGGLSVIALPSSAAGGKVSRIVTTLSGPVTTPRSDVDCVVTEWGVAHLRGLSLDQRKKAMAAIAHPKHREEFLRNPN